MSKIIKHTFVIPNLAVKDGDLVVEKETTVTCTFTLLFKGTGLYEEIAGKPLINSLMEVLGDDDNEVDKAKALSKFTDKKFIKDLACASYVKIDGDKFHNNRATAEEFRKTQVYNVLEKDLDFVVDLLGMAMECVYGEQKSKAKTKQAVRRSKN